MSGAPWAKSDNIPEIEVTPEMIEAGAAESGLCPF
jgi:hypothetical protein